MANKPFAIQGADLTLGGVNLSAGTTGVVIPGVTQAVNFRVKEVDEMPNIGGQDLGSDETAVTVIDNAEYLYLVDDGDSPSADYVAATYSVDELDELGNIKEIDVETEGVFLAADKTRAEASNMWATLDPTPFVSFNTANWTQIPFRPKMRAGEVENIGGGSGDTGDFTFDADTITNNDGMKLTTNRGTLAMGTNMEVPGVAGHFHIAFDGSNSNPPASDLFLGDDNNYVKLPGYELNPTAQFGVEIGTDNRNFGPQNIEVGTVDELVPPGGVWRLFIDHDTYPNLGSAVSVGDTVTTTWGTPITATITDVVEESGDWWKIHVAQDITAGFSGGGIVSFGSPADSYTWRFGTDGVLTLPNAMTIDASESFGTVKIGGSNTQIRIDDGGAPPGLYIRTDMAGADHGWLFGSDGDLHIPPGKTIRDAMTGDDLLAGGGTSADSNIWVQTFVSDTPLTDFPQIATSVEYDSDGNVIGLFSHFDDNSSATYFSVGKYTPSGTRIWTARLSDDFQTDGWGLAVDSVDGWIYVAGQSDGVENATYPYAQATLTKIDPANGSYDWHRVYDFGYDSASAVVDVDSTGNPIMVGYVDVNNDTDESYLAVTKISKTDGSVTWSRKLDGQADEQAYGMAVGPNNEVVAVGYMSQLAYGADNATVTVVTAPGSNVNWVTAQTYTLASVDLNITFNAGVPTITVDEDFTGGRTIGDTLGTILGSALGGVDGVDDMIVNVATISAVGDQDNRIVVVKYNSSGAIQWQRAIQFDSGFDCTGADADIDSQGNVYICGQYEVDGAADSGMALIKFNSAGVKQWSRRVEGDCISVATSIVVGPDDKLYISGVTGNNFTETFVWVVAKYSLDGLVEWQRFMENTTTWTFSGQLFNNLAGGSNIAVRQDYVALSGGFGNPNNSEQIYATLVQVPATGDVFTVGNWDFKAANLSGVLNASASDITVIDAGLTDSDNAGTIEGGPIVGDTEVSNFLIGTLYTAPGSNSSLVNGSNQLVLETTGAVTLPQGGTITEGYVTSNPTIQLTPASPSVASQKLVIKGGGGYNYTDNGIDINYYVNTAQVGDTLTFSVYSDTYADQTLYWWIYPENAGIGDTESGTVVLTGTGGEFTILIDSDAYEFTVRVSPENNNYDPANLGVESGLINADEPTFEGEHHLHLTTGNLTETSIFLGTDDHNVRTTTVGNIEITTPGIATVSAIDFGGAGYTNATYTNQATTGGSGTGLTVDYLVNTNQVVTVTINQQGLGYNNGDVITIPGGSSNATVLLDVAANNVWEFGATGSLTLPSGGTITEGGGLTGAIRLTPAGGANAYQALVIYPTANPDGDHLHLTAGGGSTELYLGNDIHYVKLVDGGDVEVRASGVLSATASWTFDTDGNIDAQQALGIKVPNGVPSSVTVINNTTVYWETNPLSNLATIGGSGTGLTVNVTETGGYASAIAIATAGTGYTSGDVITVVSGTSTANFTIAVAGRNTWTFGTTGTTTLPGALVKSTVAKTGVILPTTNGPVETLNHDSVLTGLTNGTYGPFTLDVVTFSVVVSGGVINSTTSLSSGGDGTVGGVIGTIDSGDIGGTAGTTITWSVATVAQATPTAIDLTKSVNKLTDGVYTLANGVEGQIMYLVAQNGVVPTAVSVLVANSRNIGVGTLLPFGVYDNSDDSYYGNIGGFCTLIFTDGAWQQTGGAWGIIT